MIVKIIDRKQGKDYFIEAEKVMVRKVNNIDFQDHDLKSLKKTFFDAQIIGDPFKNPKSFYYLISHDDTKSLVCCSGRVYLMNGNGKTIDKYNIL